MLEKQLKSFIGCAEYFHDHIQNFSTSMRPLHKLVTAYEKSRKIVWTQEAEESFNIIREAIRNCPTLFFLDENGEVVLDTDASDYGIGAHLFQIVNGKPRPVAFMSKSLTNAEANWSTIEKECYAIIFSLKKFEYLIRDIKFKIRTDHKNLTYMNESLCPKVRRWKLLIQEYDFDIEYIPGPQNIIADAFSRLLTVEDAHVVCLMEEFTIPTDKFLIIESIHNSRNGHFGVERTMKKLSVKDSNGKLVFQPWQHMREHVKRFIKTCNCCQKMSQIRIPIETLNFTAAAYEPMQTLNVDSIGPLPEDDEGYKYIIVIICCFTR